MNSNDSHKLESPNELNVLAVAETALTNDLEPRRFKAVLNADDVAYVLDRVGVNAEEVAFKSLLIAHDSPGGVFGEVWGLHAAAPRDGVTAVRVA